MDWRAAYRTALSLLVLASLAGAAWLLLAPPENPGIEITQPPAHERPAEEPAASGGQGLIDLNTASAAELASLRGIGGVLAARIVEYREANGPFVRIDQLMDVHGIGPATYEQVRLHVKLTR